LLIEQSSTNLLTYSQDFSNAVWVKTNATITPNAATAPDGTATMGLFQETTGTGLHTCLRIIAGTNNIVSVYAKPSGRNWIGIYSLNGIWSYFNISSGTLGTVSPGANASITPVGNGIYRCSVIPDTVYGANFCIATANGTNSYTGDGTSGVYIWGSQLEALAFATSYIPTTTAQVTRGVDIVTMTGANFSSWFNAAQGTFYVAASYESYQALRSVRPYLIFINDTGTNRFNIRGPNDNAANTPLNVLTGNNTSNSTLVAPSVNPNDKLAVSYTSTNSNFYANAIASANNPGVGYIYNGQTTIYLGCTNFGNQFDGWISKISYYPTQLTNAQLQALTT
jgi:hypothetical protein